MTLSPHSESQSPCNNTPATKGNEASSLSRKSADQTKSAPPDKRKAGRPRIKPDELATERVEVRVHPGDLSRFKAQCRANNLSVPAALRQVIAHATIQAPAIKLGPNWNAIEKHVLRNLAGYGNNFNQVAAALNHGLLKQCIDPGVLARLRDELRLAVDIFEQLKAAIQQDSVVADPIPPKAKKRRWPFFGWGA